MQFPQFGTLEWKHHHDGFASSRRLKLCRNVSHVARGRNQEKKREPYSSHDRFKHAAGKALLPRVFLLAKPKAPVDQDDESEKKNVGCGIEKHLRVRVPVEVALTIPTEEVDTGLSTDGIRRTPTR